MSDREMMLTDDVIRDLNAALNEAGVLGVEFSEENSAVAVTFLPLALDKDGNVPHDRRVLFVFSPVGRFVVSYRLGRWDDKSAKVIEFGPEQLLDKITGFKDHSIYGWDFIDSDKFDFDSWKDRASFDISTGSDQGLRHTIDWFQDQIDKTMDMRIWFGDLSLYTPTYEPISLQEFIDNGKRAWDSIYAGNEKNGIRFIEHSEYISYRNRDDARPVRGGGNVHGKK
jgi:hypothetical protein